jgi:ElaB/YqjD/DUF883 family membrane-anchored ribosome-binding protein
MPKFDLNKEVSSAKVWAMAHVVAAVAIAAAVGFILGLWVG